MTALAHECLDCGHHWSPTPPPPRVTEWTTGSTDSPADMLRERWNWDTELQRQGWTPARTQGDDTYYTRPGKDARQGHSAVLHGTDGPFVVFTTDIGNDLRRLGHVTADGSGFAFSPLEWFAAHHHGGDLSSATRALRAEMGPTMPTSTPTAPRAADGPTGADEAWPEPIAIGDEPRPPFPLDVFPDWIADQAAQAAVEMQLTPDLAAQLAITAMSIITARRVEVKINGRWKEWTNTYAVTALPPSAGKSPTVGMMTGALDQWEEELADDAERHIDDRNIDRKHLEKLRDDAQKKGEIAEAKSYADQLRDIPPIVTPRLMADDATPEKLVDMLHQQNGRLALVSTEGGLFGMMVGRYSDKANLDVYLGAWSGDTIRVDRVERGSTVVRRPRLTVGLTVQPSVLVEVGRNRELVGRGLTARFMYSRPADTVGARDKVRESTYCDHVEDRYNTNIITIARRLNERGDDEPLRLEFSPEARKRFLAWQATREALLGEHGPLRHMAEWIAKCDSTVARLAGMLRVADGVDGVIIDLATIERAIAVGEYWTEHARSTFDMMGASDDLGHARFIYGWLSSRDGNPASIKFSDIQQHAKKRVGSAAELVPAVELLIEHGWLRPEYDGPLVNLVGRGKSSPTLTLHPRLLCPHPSPLSPSSTTESDDGDNRPTLSGHDGDNGDKSPKGTCETSHSLSERLGGQAGNPGLSSPSSDDLEADDFEMDDLF